jgi:hypothetical protein
MMRLIVVVEGQTEEAFVRSVLAPHLEAYGLNVSATIVGTPKRRGSKALQKGGGHWPNWEKDIRRVLGGQRSATDVRVATLFDLYGLPEGFPGLAEHGSDTDTNRRCDKLQEALGEEFDDRRFLPYIQRHEFEALVLAALPALRELVDTEEDLAGIDALEANVAGLAPEDVNDDKKTAPSKRILRHVVSYRKVLHGPLVTESAGVSLLRKTCPRFGAWLTCLESLGKE